MLPCTAGCAPWRSEGRRREGRERISRLQAPRCCCALIRSCRLQKGMPLPTCISPLALPLPDGAAPCLGPLPHPPTCHLHFLAPAPCRACGPSWKLPSAPPSRPARQRWRPRSRKFCRPRRRHSCAAGRTRQGRRGRRVLPRLRLPWRGQTAPPHRMPAVVHRRPAVLQAAAAAVGRQRQRLWQRRHGWVAGAPACVPPQPRCLLWTSRIVAQAFYLDSVSPTLPLCMRAVAT